MRNKGTTLVEILITVGLFALFLAGVGLTLVQSYKSYVKGGKNTSLFRGASVAMQLMVKEVHTCENIYEPDQIETITSGFTANQTPLVYSRMNSQNQREVVAYRWDSQKMQIIRYSYSPDYPNNQTAINEKIIATSVQDLKFKLTQNSDGEFMNIAFTSYPDKAYFPLSSDAKITRSAPP